MSDLAAASVRALLQHTEYKSLFHPLTGSSSTTSVLRSPAFCAAVRFAMDRGGLVGADGATHCGAFDVTYMATLPNMIVMAPSDEAELIHMVGRPFALCMLQNIGLYCTGSAQDALSISASCSCTCCLLTTCRQTCVLCHDDSASSFYGLYPFCTLPQHLAAGGNGGSNGQAPYLLPLPAW